MVEHRFNSDQVIRGIEAFFREHGGVDVKLDPEEPVYTYRDAAKNADGECPLYFLCALAEYFGLDWGEERFVAWLQLPRMEGARCRRFAERDKRAWQEWEEQVAPMLTVRRFAEYLASRAPGASMAPVPVFGNACAPAGAFLGLANLPEVKKKRIAPSTKLADVLSLQNLRGFWVRAEWVSGKQLPMLVPFTSLVSWRDRRMFLANATFWLVATLLVLVAYSVGYPAVPAPWRWGMGLFSFGIICVVSVVIAPAVRAALLKSLNCLTPPGVATFGDLARIIAAGCLLFCVGHASAQFHYDDAPINYSKSNFDDAIAQLKSAIDEGIIELEWDPRHGWLPAMLDYLSVPSSSQTLVFSKTSVQRRLISPERPRALYYNDEVYIGWVQHGPILELSAVDPQQGAVFYTIDQQNQRQPVIQRDKGQCLSCHATRQTQDVPGYLVRSVFPDVRGEPRLDLGSLVTDPSTPYKQRYGGWYVTCQQGEFGHRGNLVVKDGELTPLQSEAPENLEGLINTRPYLEPGSDVVALMVLEHQALVHNLIARASYDTRHALHYDSILSHAMDRPEGHRSDSTVRRIEASAAALVRALLFCDEPPLPTPVEGSSRFAKEFAEQGPFDDQQRTLRQLDLRTRLFRYPCSYLVYSDSFDALPHAVMQEVRTRLGAALADEPAAGFEHLSDADRSEICEILLATKPELLGG